MSKPAFQFMIIMSMLLPGVAGAQGGPVAIQRFQPSMDSKGLFSLNASQVLGHLDLSFGMVVNYARRPLSLSGDTVGGPFCPGGAASCDPEPPSLFSVDNQLTSNLQVAIGLFRHVEVGLDMPLSLWDGHADPTISTDTSRGEVDGQGAGDLSLHFKGRILDTSRHPVGLALVTSLSFPTGDAEAFLGSGGFILTPHIVVDREFFDRRVMLVFNMGARLRLSGEGRWTHTRSCLLPSGTTGDCGSGRQISSSHRVQAGIGGSLAIVPQRLDLVAEVVGQVDLGDPGPDESRVYAELLAGMRLYLARRSYLSLGIGRGLRGPGSNYRYGSPDFRAFAGFTFEPGIGDRDGDGLKDDVDRCPTSPEDPDDFEDSDGCPDLDNDRDGILDTDDRCPLEPEDMDGIEDSDGCPEPDVLDRDGDGIPDDRDRCPDAPEDKDRFEDHDGCPDPDNDRDRILDVDDLCPNRPEDRDRFEDDDGCPDPDNDKDGILDVDDGCPVEPETKNGYLDKDGCPDKRPFKTTTGKIDLLKKIYFKTDSSEIRRVSHPLLDAIAHFLRTSPEILLVEIQGHADERGSATYNLRLTSDRTRSVRRYLTDKGVPGERLRSRGFGERRPLDRRHNVAAWSKNRRVEFIILKRAR